MCQQKIKTIKRNIMNNKNKNKNNKKIIKIKIEIGDNLAVLLPFIIAVIFFLVMLIIGR